MKRTISSIESLESFEREYISQFRQIEKKILENNKLSIYCSFCESNTESTIKSTVFFDKNPSLREGLICRECNLSSRARLIFEHLNHFANLESNIYLNEQHTLFSDLFITKYSKTICSSYVTDQDLSPGESFFGRNKKKYRYEDFTRTSFATSTFDCIVTCDVLEHIPDYTKALSESFRILKPGGTLLLQVPVFGGLNDHNVRAIIRDNKVIHILEPEVHGDPNSPEGILAFYNFSFKLISDLKAAGFSKVNAEIFHSVQKGYFTDNNPYGDPYPTTNNWGVMLPLIFSAVK